MSIQALAWVLDHSKSRGISRLVLISLANHHNGGTDQCNPGQRLIAKEAGIGAGTVSAAIQRLVTLGEVEIAEAGGARRSAQYVLTFAREPSDTGSGLAREPSAARGPGASAARGPGPRGTIKNQKEPEEKTASLVAQTKHIAEKARAKPRSATKDDPFYADAESILAGWWEEQHPRPTVNYARARDWLVTALRAGWSNGQAATALRSVRGVLAEWKLGEELERQRSRSSGTRRDFEWPS